MENKFVALEQGTNEWHAWRATKVTASDVGAVMGLSPFETAFGLWEKKIGARPPTPDNPAMARGRALEPQAREAWEGWMGASAPPVCCEHAGGVLAASLDGWCAEKGINLEIKCPGNRTHELVLSGEVPDYYLLQVQAQMACIPFSNGNGLKTHFVSFNPDHHDPMAVIVVEPDLEVQARILEAVEAFWAAVVGGYPPATSLASKP